MSSNPLAPASILKQLADALPTHEAEDPTSDLSSSLESIALFTHGCMAALNFRLLGFDDERKIEEECARLAPRLPSQWNASVSSLGFVYAHPQSAMQFIIKVDRLGGKTEICGLAVGDNRISRVDIITRDYISTSALPVRITKAEDGTEDRSDLQEKLKKVFISDERMSDLVHLFKVSVIQRLLPSLHKEGYQELGPVQTDEEMGSARHPPPGPSHPQQPQMPEPARPHPYPVYDPLAPAGPFHPPVPMADFPPPGFEDEYEVNRPPRQAFQPGISPFNIGYDDLNPPGLGPHDPLRANFIGGGLPQPGFGGFGAGGSGGMHPTFDDPLFQGPHGQGNGQFDPQAPPGARWDPVGPGGAPRFGGGRPGTNPFGGNGGFGGGFGGGDII